MDKRDNYENDEGVKIEDILKNEKVLWTLKPNKKAYIYGRLFDFDIMIMIYCIVMIIVTTGFFFYMKLLMVKLFSFSVMIVHFWILCKGWNSFANLEKLWKCEEYCITEKRIILRIGNSPMEISSFYYDNIKELELENGLINSFFGVGNIVIKEYSQKVEDIEEASINYPKMYYIDRPYDVYTHLQKFLTERKKVNKNNDE